MTATTQSGKKSSQYNLKLLNLEINSSIGKLNTRSSSFAQSSDSHPIEQSAVLPDTMCQFADVDLRQVNFVP